MFRITIESANLSKGTGDFSFRGKVKLGPCAVTPLRLLDIDAILIALEQRDKAEAYTATYEQLAESVSRLLEEED